MKIWLSNKQHFVSFLSHKTRHKYVCIIIFIMFVLHDDVGLVHDIMACSDSYSTVSRCWRCIVWWCKDCI